VFEMYPVPLKGLLPPNQNMNRVVDNLGTYTMYMAGYVLKTTLHGTV